MPKKYRIREGFSFVCDDNDVKRGGEIVMLPDDVAANHAHKLELQDEADAVAAVVRSSRPKPAPTADQA